MSSIPIPENNPLVPPDLAYGVEEIEFAPWSQEQVLAVIGSYNDSLIDRDRCVCGSSFVISKTGFFCNTCGQSQDWVLKSKIEYGRQLLDWMSELYDQAEPESA